MRQKISKYFILFFLFASIYSAKATHIVGGEITYTCLGDNQYEIILTVFRDCINGNPNAYFDNPASIGIFGEDNDLITSVGNNGQLLIELMNDDTLDPVLTNPCLVVPPNVCVHTSTYRSIVDLPFRSGGYQLAYQRCCRNQTIVNIIEPLASGATYGVTITEEALLECNSSAKFRDWPPLYICVNEPIFFDQSAVDIDNDSIVYQLCAPLLGASPDFPLPQPPNPPPYNIVNWISPPYGVENMLNGFGGGAPLAIDPNTGLLTGLPNTIGQFVVGICLEEFRNGEIISTTRRDFQYNVGVCGETVSSFFTPEVVCNDQLTVSFDNQSANADQFLWFFNDPLNPGASSTMEEPVYAYGDTGTYQIMLIAEPGNTCVDTFFQTISVQRPSITADVEVVFGDCNNGQEILITDLSIDEVGQVASWEWVLFLNNIPLDTLTEQNPVFQITSSGIYRLRLTVISSTGCTSSTEETINIVVVEEEIENELLQLCSGGGVNLNNTFAPQYIYEWTPAGTLDDPNLPNPRATPTETTIYRAMVSDSMGLCTRDLEVTVFVPPPIILDLTNDTVTCLPNISLSANSIQADQFIWSDDPDFDNILGEEATVEVTPIGTQTYFLLVRDSFGCAVFDSVQITGNGINVEVDDLTLLCEGEFARLQLENLDSNDILTYNWFPEEYIQQGGMTSQPFIERLDPGTYFLFVEMTNQFNCTLIDTVEVGVLDTLPTLSAFTYSQCSGFNVEFFNNNANGPYFVWDFGDPTQPDLTSDEFEPSHTYPGPGDYVVQLYYNSFISCADTLFLPITVTEPTINLGFTPEFITCGDSAVVEFMNNSVNGQGAISDYQWNFSNGETSVLENPIITFLEPGTYLAELIANSDNGCSDTLFQSFIIPLVEETINDTILICAGDTVFANPGFNPDYQYNWSPANAVSDPTSPNPLIGPIENTVYTITVTSAEEASCMRIETLVAIVPPLLTLEASEDQQICGDSVVLMASTNLPAEFLWSLTPNFGLPIGTESEISVRPTFLGTYFLQARDSAGCILRDTIQVSNNAIDAGTVGQSICRNDTVQLQVTNFLPGIPLTYEWNPIETIIGSSTDDSVLVSPTNTTTYSVFMENAFGCSATRSATVEVLDNNQSVDITLDSDTIIVGQTIQLGAFPSLPGSFQWSGDSTLSAVDIAAPTAQPIGDQTYTVLVTDERGCTASASVRVTVVTPDCDLPFVFFPNAFTPNGDGENDLLQLYGVPVESAYWAIFNRWGEKVFETHEVNGTWDGRYKGERLAPDVYGYYLEVNCFGEGNLRTRGNVTLIR